MAFNPDNVDLSSLSQVSANEGLDGDNVVDDNLDFTMSEAVKVNPDQHAQTLDLSRKSGVPAFAVEANPEAVEADLKSNVFDFSNLRETNPKTANHLTNVDNAIVAQDDIDVLKELEDIFDVSKVFGGLGETITTGWEAQGTGIQLAGVDASADKIQDLIPMGALPMGITMQQTQNISRDFAENLGITTDEQLATAKEQATEQMLGQLRELQEKRQQLTPEDMNLLEEGVRAGFESLGNMAPATALMLASGGRAAPLLTTIGLQTFGGSFGDARAEGLTPQESAWFAGIDAAIEVGTEILPTGTLERILTGKSTGMKKEALKFMVQEMGTEQLATLGQSINSYAFGLDEQMEQAETVEEMVQIQLRRQAVTAIATVVAGGTQAAAATGIRKTVDALAQDENKKQTQTETEQTTIDRINKQSEKSKLRERDKESFKQFVNEADGDQNSTVFIDGAQTALYLQTKTPDEIESDPALSLLADQAREASNLGGDVQVPVADFAADVAGTEHYEQLRDSMTMSGETVSPFRQEQVQQETEAYVRNLMEEAQENTSEYVEAQEIYTTVREQLIDSGQVNAQNASVMAQIVPAWATAQARRQGKTVQQVYQDAGLTIEGPQTGERARLEGEQVLEQQDMLAEMLEEFEAAFPELAGRPLTEEELAVAEQFEFGEEQGSVFDVQEFKDKRDQLNLPEERTKIAGYTPERVDRLLRDWVHANGMETRARVAYVDPVDFVAATHPDVTTIEADSTELDPEQLRETGTPFLRTETSGEIIGHEGRHRMMALAKAGYKSVPIVITQPEYTSDSATLNLKGQVFSTGKSMDLTVENAVPILHENVEQFTTEEADLFFQGQQDETTRRQDERGGRQAVATEEAATRQEAIEEAKGRDDAEALAEFERAKSGETVTFTRRSRGLHETFDDTKLGANTTTPSAFLGHYLSAADVGNVEKYGPELSVYEVTLKDPLIISAEAFENATADLTPEQAAERREQFIEMGHDGILVEGLNWMIVFEGANVQRLEEDVEGLLEGVQFEQGQVDPLTTPEFKSWFKNSEVIDESGNPQVVYHGTPADVSEEFTFDYTKIGEQGRAEGAGFYFTPRKSIAEGYADGGTLLEVYLSIQNPIEFNQESFDEDVLRELIQRIAEIEAQREGTDIADGFLSNFGDISFEGIDSVINEAVEIIAQDETALDQISGIVGAGVDIEVVNRATEEVTGHDGVKSEGFSGRGGDDIWVAFFPEQIKSTENVGRFNPRTGDIFRQRTGEKPTARGYYDPANSVIRLTEAADLSTFLHEFAHFMYEMEVNGDTEMLQSINNWYKRNAEEVAKEAMTYDENIIILPKHVEQFLDEGAVTEPNYDEETNTRATKAIRRAVHEQFARGFETYLMEGKAPSIELRNAFRAFARWLARIYQAMRGQLDVNLDAEMRAVLDRLLATEEQIAAAEARARVEPMFTDAAMAGMTEQEFADYQTRQEKVKDKQSETLRDKLIKQLTRQTKAWWKEEKQDIIDEELETLGKEQVYTARARLRDGDLKLDHATVKEMVGEEKTNKLGRTSTVIPPKLSGMTAKGQQGVHPDEAAAFFGYSSGSEMLKDLSNAPAIKAQAETNAEARMVDRHGDILTDGTIEQQADEAVQNEERGKLILRELKILARGTNAPVIERNTIKALAEERIGKLSFRENHPAKYRRAEIRAAQESARMLAEGNKEGAAEAKMRQVMNYYLGMASTNAKNETGKIVDRMTRYRKKKVREEIMKAEGGYWDQISKILSRFEFKKTATLKEVESLNTWMQERNGSMGDSFVLTNAVLNESYVTHWKNVPFTDLQGINDSVKNIEHVARYANKLTRMQEEIDFNKLVDRWVTSMNENVETRFESKRTDVAEGKKWGRWFMAQMTKIPFMASWLDGGERAGISHQILVQPFTDAYNAEIKLWEKAGLPVMEAIEGRSKEDRKRHNRKVYIPAIDDNLYGHQILAVALNTGNQSNLKKMLLGEGWADPENDAEITFNNPKLQAVLSSLTKSDWELVQMIWDQMDTLYPDLAEVHRRTTGLTPPKVEATPVETEYGTFRGGYYPVKYDPNRGLKAQFDEDKLNAETESMFSNSASIQASVNTGATNERTGYYAPIRLSIDVVPAHFQETIHYITHHDPVREINRLTRNAEVASTIKEKLGPEEYAQLKPWLNDIAKDGREAPTKMFWDDMLQRLRFGVTLGTMGFKASTGIIQISGLSNTVAEVGLNNVMQSARLILGSTTTMKQAWDFAVENSNVLEHRTQTMDREIKNAMKRIEGKRGVLAAAQEASMKHIALIQTYMVDLPSWHAAYMKGMTDWGDETRAFQYADWVIENVQGSGATKDMARIMRGQSETGRMFTMFMTFFSSLWNMQRDLVKGAKSGKYSKTSVAAKAMFLFTIPVLFEMMMRGELGEPEDEDDRLQRMLTGVAMYPVQSIPFIRDVASATTGDFGYNISPLQSIIEQGTRTIPQLVTNGFTDEEMTKGQVKGATKFVGAATGIPGVNQAWATGEHLYDVIEAGEEFTLHQFLFGPERD